MGQYQTDSSDVGCLHGFDVFVKCFIEKATMFSYLAKYFVFYKLLISDPLFFAAKTRSIVNFKLKSLRLSYSSHLEENCLYRKLIIGNYYYYSL